MTVDKILIEAVITVDIFCQWEAEPRAYRIYVDDELLTERTYLWRNSDQFVQENIVISVAPGDHQFKLEPVDTNFSGFQWQNFTINGQPTATDCGRFVLN